MKVMLIGDYERFSLALTRHPDVQLSMLCDPAQIEATRRRLGIEQVYPYVRRPKLHPRSALEVRRAVQAVRPDIIHAFTGRPLASAVLGTIALSAAPHIVSFRGITARATRRDVGNLVSYLHPRVAGHACESNAVRDSMIASGIDANRCVTTYGCIDPGRLNQPGFAVREMFDIPRNAFVVATVATMRPVKGIDLLLQAAVACANLKDIYWLLIGPVRDRSITRLSEDPRIRQRVRLTGFQPRAADLVSGADLFVMPSRHEALCRALLEAMAQGVCPLVSDAGGMKEAVRHAEDGWVVPREDVAALAAAIRQLHADPDLRLRLALSAGQRARSQFSPQQMAERSLTLYRRVLAGTAAGAIPASPPLVHDGNDVTRHATSAAKIERKKIVLGH